VPDTTTTHTHPADERSGRSPRELLRWFLAPATDGIPAPMAVSAVVVRIVLGFLWLWNVNWKVPPDFGADGQQGLYRFTAYAVDYPVFPPYAYVVEHVVLPNLSVFGWGVVVAETALAVMLLAGAWVRLALVLGIAQSVVIALSTAFAPNEWAWAYLLMIAAHLALLGSAPGRYLAVDAVRAGLTDGRTLARVFGGVAVVAGGYSVLNGLGDPLAANGPQIGTSSWEVGLGSFNVLGGAVLLVVGLALVASERVGAVAAWTAVGVALAAAVLMRVQAGFPDRLLGGGGTSTALLLTLALVAATRARALADR
jgi:hypothetical protein